MAENTNTYINILIDTLRKKEEILKSLLAKTEAQAVILEADEFETEAFDTIIEEKDGLLEELKNLDDGFLDLYSRVGAELKNNTEAYADQVKTAQELVRRQTEISAELTSAEERNKAKLAIRLSQGRQKIKEFKVGAKTAAAYYKNMSGKHQDGDSYFFNREK
ncbi:MAG: flagellar export chaperone FlgN [Lachnospiraceae bacterium]|nr:flagellar export chaperone FlgN [Lachnospiraceae bacterium]